MMLLRVMTLVQRVALSLLVLSLLGWTGNRDVTSPDPFEPTTGPGVAPLRAVSPDTLQTTAKPGTPLILPLPATINDHSVAHYSLLRGPALSGVAGRSFTWIPEGTDPGPYEALLQAHLPDAPADTLVVRIDLQS